MSASAVTISAVAHLGLAAAVIAAATIWQAQKPRVYIVNLVPAVAALGSPSGHAKATPQAPVREDPAPRAARFTPVAKEPVPKERAIETTSIPALPETTREVPRLTATARPAPALPDTPAVRDLRPPASAPPKLNVPPLPGQRTAPRPAEEERALPHARADVRREPPARIVKFARVEEPPRRPTLRDAPPDAARRPTTLPGAAVPDVPPPSSPTAATRPMVLPKAGQKELPSLASSSPAPTPIARTPVVTPAAKVLPSAEPPPAPVALGRTTGSPQGSGAITMQVSDFPFAWYLQAVQRKVIEKWAPPTRGLEGRAVIVFEIGRNGEVRRPSVENSSGDALYDRAALRAITDANPFPPLPAEFKESALLIHLGFDFTADRG